MPRVIVWVDGWDGKVARWAGEIVDTGTKAQLIPEGSRQELPGIGTKLQGWFERGWKIADRQGITTTQNNTTVIVLEWREATP